MAQEYHLILLSLFKNYLTIQLFFLVMAAIISSVFLCIIITYLFGFVINLLFFSNLLKNQSSNFVFHSSVFIGFLSSIILTALITTLGHTIFIVSLLPVSFLLYRNFSIPHFNKKKILFYLKSSIVPLCFTCLSALVCFIFTALKHDFFAEDIIYTSWGDNGFYINVADYIQRTGIENTNSWYSLYGEYSIDNTSVFPYHYGELYLYNYISFFKLFPISPLFYYLYVFLSCVGALNYSALSMLMNYLFNDKAFYRNYLLPLVVMFCLPFTYYLTPLAFFFLLYPKCFALIPILCFSLVLLYKNKYIESISVFILLPIFHIFYAPAIYTTIFIFSLFLLYLNINKKDVYLKRTYYYGFFISFLSALLILVFYYDFIMYYKTLNTSDHLFSSSPNAPLWRQLLDIAKYYFWYWIMYVLVILLYKLNSKFINHKLSIFYVFVFPIVQMLIGNITTYLEIPEHGQFYALLSPIISVLFCLAFYISSVYYKQQKLIAPLILMVILVTGITFFYKNQQDPRSQRINKNFINELQKKSQPIKNKLGLFYADKNNQIEHYPHILYLGGVGNILKSIGNDFWAINVNYKCSIYEIENCPNNSDTTAFTIPITVLKNTPYYKFYEAKKDEINNETDLQLAFIEEMKVEFVIAISLDEVPFKIREKAKTTIIDPESKIAFLIFK